MRVPITTFIYTYLYAFKECLAPLENLECLEISGNEIDSRKT